jgi:Cu+-exporting ATPase
MSAGGSAIETDPICQMQVDPSTAIFAERDGKVFYFCGEGCRRRFLGEPAPAPPASVTAAYYCPMCEGVESDQPGACPRCGMALVPSATGDGEPDDSELHEMSRRLAVAAVLSAPLFAISMGPMLGLRTSGWLPGLYSGWIEAALATPVVLWAGYPFFERGVRSVTTWNLNMFTLIAVGTGAAFGYSAVGLLAPGWFPASVRVGGHVPLYFEASAVIITLVLLGQVLELRAHRRTSAAIRELIDLAPRVAHVLRDGTERDIPLAEVIVGDTLSVRPGEKVPVDGQVCDGRSSLDESMISGEAIAREVSNGDAVIGGTVNQSGAFRMLAERVGSDTVLAQIVAMVGAAQRSRAPVQRQVDRVSAVFVPVVFLCSLLAFAGWALLGPEPRLGNAFVSAVAVLIIACPCALGLATPISIMVGVGRGARDGVLFRDAASLERLRDVDVLIVDKTGTLTEGHPTLTTLETFGDHTQDQLLGIAAALESASEHPLARAVVAAARERNLPIEVPDAFESEVGAGIRGEVRGHQVRIGSRAFLESADITQASALESSAHALQSAGNTVIHCAIDGTLAGILAVSDPIKPQTPAALDQLRTLGLRIIMLTGDDVRVAQAVASTLGIVEFEAGVSPADKHDRVVALRAEGLRVAMAGDGINDAPALAAADVGIAMGTGTDIAIESAGVTLVNGDLSAVSRAIALSRAVIRNIRQNLFFAFVYNGLGIPIAAGALYSTLGISGNPMIAAAAMSASSVSVIANALRLRTVRLRNDT